MLRTEHHDYEQRLITNYEQGNETQVLSARQLSNHRSALSFCVTLKGQKNPFGQIILVDASGQ